MSPKSQIKNKQVLKSVIALTINFITGRISCKVDTLAIGYIPYSILFIYHTFYIPYNHCILFRILKYVHETEEI